MTDAKSSNGFDVGYIAVCRRRVIKSISARNKCFENRRACRKYMTQFPHEHARWNKRVIVWTEKIANWTRWIDEDLVDVQYAIARMKENAGD